MQDDLTPDHYWAAGFLEGEGCFTPCKGRPRINAAQVQREPLDRLQRLFGGTIRLVRRDNPKWNDCHIWNLHIGAEDVSLLLYPLLSSRRQAQIDKALAECREDAAKRPGTGAHQRAKQTCPNGHAYDKIRLNPDGTFRGRECTVCRNERRRKRYKNDPVYRDKIKAEVYARRRAAT